MCGGPLAELGICVMTIEEAFIQAIRAAWFDDAPRLIYADWLEEQGKADRAEFIRIQCRLRRVPDSDPDKAALNHRAEELLRDHWEEWVGPLRDIVGPRRDQYGAMWMSEIYQPLALRLFSRGFVCNLTLDAEDYLRHARSLRSLTPLHSLTLWRGGRCARRLAEEPTLPGLHSLGFFGYYDAPLMAGDMAALAASPYLQGLSALHLSWNSLGDEGIEALVQAPWLAGVSYLNLTENGFSDRGAHAIAKSPSLSNLHTLVLDRNYLSPEAVAALANSPKLRGLSRLVYKPPTEDWPAMRSPSP